MTLTPKQRAYLRKLSNPLEAIFQVGKAGVTPELVDAVSDALEKRELVKVSLLGNCDEEMDLVSDKLSKRTRSTIVLSIGRKFVLYRPSKKPKIVLPG